MNLHSATSTCISAPWAGDNCDRPGGAAQASHGCCAGPHHPLDRQARSEHAVAALGRAFWFELVVKHCTNFGRFGVKLLRHVLEPVSMAVISSEFAVLLLDLQLNQTASGARERSKQVGLGHFATIH